MAQAVVLEWLLPGRHGSVIAAMAGPPGPTGLEAIERMAGDLLQDVGGNWVGQSLTQVLANGASVGGQLNSAGTVAMGATVATPDVVLNRDGADILALRRGASPQALRAYNSYIDLANYERANLSWEGNTLFFGTQAAGTGAIRDIVIRRNTTSYMGFGVSSALWNITAGGHLMTASDSTYDIGGSGANRPRNGNFGGFLTVGSSLTLGSTSPLVFGSRSTLTSPADGQVTLNNAAATDFDRLNFGGASNAFPALKRLGTTLQARLADDSGRAGLEASALGLTSDLSLASTSKFNWNSDLFLVRDAANLLAQRNGTSPQVFRLYQTYTDASNGAWLDVGWNVSNNGWTIGAGKNGTGAYGYLYINIGGTPRWYFGAGTNEFGPNADNTCDIGTAGGRVRVAYAYKLSGGSSAGNIDLTGAAVKLDLGGNTNNPDNFQFVSRSWSGAMAATGRWIGSQVTIAPTAGGASQQSHLSLRSTINQTGTHTGDIVIYHADVTVTAAQGATYFAQYSLGGAAKFQVSTAGRVTAAEGLVTTPAPYGSLPASPSDGQRAFITDSNVAAAGNFGVAAVGGGSNHVPVYYDGGAGSWKIG